MDKEAGLILIYFGLILPALVGGHWMSSWLYFRKEDTRHWVYIVALFALMVLQASFFRGAPSRSALFAVVLAILGAGIGALLGGMFGQFFSESQGGGGNVPVSGDPEP